jgi:hypothetical protein
VNGLYAAAITCEELFDHGSAETGPIFLADALPLLRFPNHCDSLLYFG